MIQKNCYIIDTCVLIYDPNAYKSFHSSDVILPIDILTELDKLKTKPDETGKNARLCIRGLDELCSKGEIHKGIKLENDILIKIDTTNYENTFGPDSYIDNKILACVVNTAKNNKKKNVVLVSRDINLRIRAMAYGIEAEDYDNKVNSSSDLYTGWQEIKDEEVGLALNASSGFLDNVEWIENLQPNECVHLIGENGKGLALASRVGKRLKKITDQKVWGLEARSKEQAMAMYLLTNKDIPLVSLVGPGGVGKSLVAIAAALEMVVEKKKYQKMIIYKPIESVGKEIGFLPGTVDDKVLPYFGSVLDSFEYLFSNGGKKSHNWQDTLNMLVERGTIELQPLTYIRGRSINNALIICDEIQNLGKHELKTLLTRSGQNNKIICLGDVQQIDANYDATNNALSIVIEKFKTYDLAGHMSLTKCERSDLAALASEIL